MAAFFYNKFHATRGGVQPEDIGNENVSTHR